MAIILFSRSDGIITEIYGLRSHTNTYSKYDFPFSTLRILFSLNNPVIISFMINLLKLFEINMIVVCK